MVLKVPEPRPPTPMRAPPNESLGGVYPGPPSTCRGTMVKVADAAAAPFRKLRRVTFRRCRVTDSLLSRGRLSRLPPGSIRKDIRQPSRRHARMRGHGMVLL